jgi:two-component system, sensor histidine kinase PdtaS
MMSAKQQPTASKTNNSSELFRQPHLLERVVEIADDAIISIDTEGHIRLFNQGAERIFGYSAGEILGSPLSVLIPARFRRLHAQHILEFAKSPSESRVMAQRGEIHRAAQETARSFPPEASISKVEVDEGMVAHGHPARRQRDASLVERTHAELAAKRRRVLLREVHHRVKNNLQVVSSLLNLQARAAARAAKCSGRWTECQQSRAVDGADPRAAL